MTDESSSHVKLKIIEAGFVSTWFCSDHETLTNFSILKFWKKKSLFEFRITRCVWAVGNTVSTQNYLYTTQTQTKL